MCVCATQVGAKRYLFCLGPVLISVGHALHAAQAWLLKSGCLPEERPLEERTLPAWVAGALNILACAGSGRAFKVQTNEQTKLSHGALSLRYTEGKCFSYRSRIWWRMEAKLETSK